VLVADINDNQPDINVIFLSAEDLGTLADRRVRRPHFSPRSRLEAGILGRDSTGRRRPLRVDHAGPHNLPGDRDVPLDRESRPNYTLRNRYLHGQPITTLVQDVPSTGDGRQPAGVRRARALGQRMFETTERGTSVARVLTTDDDENEGGNAALTYKMRDTPPLWFQVYPLTGVGGHSGTNELRPRTQVHR